MALIQIISSSGNYTGQTAVITFYSSNNPATPVDLGSQILPYNREGNDVYGNYEVNFTSYNKTCSVTINNPEVSVTPTLTPTPTPTSSTIPVTPTSTITSTPTITPTSSIIPATPTPTTTVTPTLTASITPTPTPTVAASVSSLSVVSGSTQGSGTSASPYLVATDTSPSPIYQANTPGILTVNFTSNRTVNCYCGKSGCSTCRVNESVHFKLPDGNFYEQLRTHLTYPYSSSNITSLSYPVHLGQQFRMSQHAGVREDGYPTGDNNRQLTNTRIVFTPMNDPNFSISYVGSRTVIGNGTASNPYVNSATFSSNLNERTNSFRANGDGIVAIFGGANGAAFTHFNPSPVMTNVFLGGSANSFTGGRLLGFNDFFNFRESEYNILPRPNRFVNFLRVTNGQIFSFAGELYDKGRFVGFQEVGGSAFHRPMICAVPNSTTENSVWLMNTNLNLSANTWQTSNTWSGLGTSSSPASMNSFKNNRGVSNLFFANAGTVSFDYQTTTGSSLSIRVLRTNIPGFDLNDVRYGQSTIATLNQASGSASVSVNAFNGLNFAPSSISDKNGTYWTEFKITNLVFTPS